MITKKQKLEAEIRAIAAIENAFKKLGREVYKAYKIHDDLLISGLLSDFHTKLNKLKQEAKNAS